MLLPLSRLCCCCCCCHKFCCSTGGGCSNCGSSGRRLELVLLPLPRLLPQVPMSLLLSLLLLSLLLLLLLLLLLFGVNFRRPVEARRTKGGAWR